MGHGGRSRGLTVAQSSPATAQPSPLARLVKERVKLLAVKITHERGEESDLSVALRVFVEIVGCRLAAQDPEQHMLGCSCTHIGMLPIVPGTNPANEPLTSLPSIRQSKIPAT
jgi:hypothetical protein